MPRSSNQTHEHPERLVAIELLGRPRGRDRDRMYRTLRQLSRETVDEAIASLEQAGVVVIAGRTIKASSALVRLERLNLIGI
jgi:DNA-binding MurR/RpiR family transcriptional regulator